MVRAGVVHEDEHNNKRVPDRRFDPIVIWQTGSKAQHKATVRQQVGSPANLEDQSVSKSRSGVACASPPAAGARFYGDLSRRELSRNRNAGRDTALDGDTVAPRRCKPQERKQPLRQDGVFVRSPERVAVRRPFLLQASLMRDGKGKNLLRDLRLGRPFPGSAPTGSVAAVGAPHRVLELAGNAGPIDLGVAVGTLVAAG